MSRTEGRNEEDLDIDTNEGALEYDTTDEPEDIADEPYDEPEEMDVFLL